MTAHAGDGGVQLAAPAPDPALQVRQVLLNGLSLLGAYVFPRLFTFAAAVVAARVLGVATFGAYGSAAALAIILSILATLGMMQLLVREVARSPERAAELIGAAHVAKSASVVLMLAALLAVAGGALGYGGEVLAATLLLGLSYAAAAYGENVGAYFQGVERMGVWLQAQALYGIVFGGLGIVLVLTTRDLVWFCTAPIAGQLAAVGWLLVRAPTAVRRSWRAPLRLVLRLLRSLLPFAAAFLLLTAYYKVDILLLQRIAGEREAGLYAAAYKFFDMAHALALVVAAAVYPRLSRLSAAGGGGRAAGRSAELLLLGAVPAAGLLWLLRVPVIQLLFGEAYAGSALALGLLAPALPFLALNQLGTFILAAAERMRAVATLYLLGLLLNAGLNVLLIPSLGATGSAVAMLVSEAAVGAGMLLALRGLAASAPRLAPVLVAVAAGAAAAVLGLLGAAGSLAVGLLYGSLVVAGYALIGVVTPAERALLRQAVAR